MSAPSYKLDVAGSARVSANLGAGAMHVASNAYVGADAIVYRNMSVFGTVSIDKQLIVTDTISVDGGIGIQGGDCHISGSVPGDGAKLILCGAPAGAITNYSTSLIPCDGGFAVWKPDLSTWIMRAEPGGWLWVCGGIRCGGVEYPSDTRFKLDIEALDYGLDEVMKLKPRRYFRADWHKDPQTGLIKVNTQQGTNDIGLVAQEVQSVIPEAVKEPEDPERDLWGLDYGKLIPVIIKAMQEQQVVVKNVVSLGDRLGVLR